jgi:hypothetical protein
MGTTLANRIDASASSPLLRGPVQRTAPRASARGHEQARIIALKPHVERRIVELTVPVYTAGPQTFAFEPPEDESREHVLMASACLFALGLLIGLAVCALVALVALQLLTG